MWVSELRWNAAAGPDRLEPASDASRAKAIVKSTRACESQRVTSRVAGKATCEVFRQDMERGRRQKSTTWAVLIAAVVLAVCAAARTAPF